MKPFKVSAAVVAALLLTGCAPGPTPSASPSSTVKVITGEPEVDEFISILNASCKQGQKVGLAVAIPKNKATTYAFPQSDYFVYEQPWNMMTKTPDGYQIGGWSFDGDVLCNEAAIANRVVPKGSAPNQYGEVFNYKYVEVKPGTVDWSVQREFQSFDPVRFSFANGLVTSVEYPTSKYVLKYSYGPFSKTVDDAYEAALISSGNQYMYLSPPLWGMTLSQAKAYCKKNGLTVVVGVKDGDVFFPSGPPGGISDPKRMIVFIYDGIISGVATM
jgi:hypothetical protein